MENWRLRRQLTIVFQFNIKRSLIKIINKFVTLKQVEISCSGFGKFGYSFRFNLTTFLASQKLVKILIKAIKPNCTQSSNLRKLSGKAINIMITKVVKTAKVQEMQN